MNRRKIKKTAKRYMASNKTYLPYGKVSVEHQAYNDGTPPVYKIFARFPCKVARYIYILAEKEGWDGFHWSDPLLLGVDDAEAREYEELYNPPHLW